MAGRTRVSGVVGDWRIGDVAEVSDWTQIAGAPAGLSLVPARVALHGAGASVRAVIPSGADHSGAHVCALGAEVAASTRACRLGEAGAGTVGAGRARRAVRLQLVAGAIRESTGRARGRVGPRLSRAVPAHRAHVARHAVPRVLDERAASAVIARNAGSGGGVGGEALVLAVEALFAFLRLPRRLGAEEATRTDAAGGVARTKAAIPSTVVGVGGRRLIGRASHAEMARATVAGGRREACRAAVHAGTARQAIAHRLGSACVQESAHRAGELMLILRAVRAVVTRRAEEGLEGRGLHAAVIASGAGQAFPLPGHVVVGACRAGNGVGHA